MPTDYEIVTKFATAFGNKDFDTALPLLSPDVVFVEPAGLPHEGEWTGLEGIGALGQKIVENFEFEVHGVETFDGGDRVFVQAEVEFKSRQSGATARMPIIEVYEVEDGLIVRNTIFYQDVPALAGLHDAVATS